MIYSFGLILGWVNVALLGLLCALFPARKVLSPKNPFLVWLRRLHPVASVLFFLSAGIHGYLVWGSIAFNSGQLLLGVVLLTAVLGGLAPRLRKPLLFKAHFALPVVIAALVVWHVWG